MGKKKPKSKSSKTVVASPAEPQKTDINFIAEALSSVHQTVFVKVCRLCESKDGPFLNIFDSDKATAKKIEELMPFRITENDDLPHKICFRCSAKVEELYEFVQKCIKTQHSLHNALGKKVPFTTKTKTRTLWEEKLNKSNMSNDDICDALIKKAMEGIKGIPLQIDQKPLDKTGSSEVVKKKSDEAKKETTKEASNVKVSPNKNEEKFIPTRTSRSQSGQGLLDGLPDSKRILKHPVKTSNNVKEPTPKTSKKYRSDDDSSSDSEVIKKPAEPKPEEPKPEPEDNSKPFDIMDHISMIKVNGVGVLFQCKLCNRNFLKMKVVQTHGCARNGGVPKQDFTKNIPTLPEVPKVSTVKYINTKVDGEFGNANTKSKPDSIKSDIVKKPETRTKPKIGPASKVKRSDDESEQTKPPATETVQKAVTPSASTVPSLQSPSVQFPSIPSLNSRYKLVPGPNNTFQLVEESPTPVTNTENVTQLKVTKKRKGEPPKIDAKVRKQLDEPSKSKVAPILDVIDLESTPDTPEVPVKKSSQQQPYPVGLFQTVAHHSGAFPPATAVPEPTFTTPAMKKQLYTVVQTGNPSKLLISTKPQPPVEESQKKRQRKSKLVAKEDNAEKEPFNVTLEDAAPPKDAGFFTFINVDPLLQPSYVLPTDNIIQESQISTSTPLSKASTEKDKYSCNMCNETFSREKKLLAHIHSHYSKLDEEDMIRAKNNKKKGKKS